MNDALTAEPRPRAPDAAARPAPEGTNGVAVVIAAYEAEDTIARAVRSALAQPEALQVCVVDDGSGDWTAERARACDDGSGRLQVIRLERNAGPSAARNLAIATTTAVWVTVLDADDYMLPGRLQRLLAYGEEADFIGDALLRVDAAAADPADPELGGNGQGRAVKLDLERFARGNLGDPKAPLDLGYLKPLVRRSVLARANLRYDPELRLGEDYDLYLRILAEGGRGLLVPAAGYVSVVRPGSLSRAHGADDLQRLRDCDLDLERRALPAAERRALRARRRSVDRRLQWRRLIDAVKARDLAAALRTFRAPHVALHLAVRLAEQVWLRSRKRVARTPTPRPRADPGRRREARAIGDLGRGKGA